MAVEYLQLGDYLIIAEQVLGVPVDTLRRLPGIALARSAHIAAGALDEAAVIAFADWIADRMRPPSDGGDF